MQFCELIPLKTTNKIDFLSYYTNLEVSSGDLVSINMNNQKLDAIVFSAGNIKDNKIDIKSQTFKMKKVVEIIEKNYIEEELLIALYNISTLLGTNINNILNTLIRVETLKRISFTKRKISPSCVGFTNDYKVLDKIFLIEKKSSAHIITPTRVRAKQYAKIYGENFVSTPSFNFLINKEVDTVYIVNECSKHYYSEWKGLDTKLAITEVCKLLNIDVVLIDSYPSIKTYYDSRLNENKNNQILESLHKVKLLKMNDETNVQVKKSANIQNIYIHEYLKNIIKNSIPKNEKIFIYNLRKGLYPSSICNDCNNYVKCKNCGSTLIINEIEGVRYYVCNKCNIKNQIEKLVLCEACNSYNIKTMGIGTAGIKEYLNEELNINSNIIDKDNVNKVKDIKVLTKSYEEVGGIIIGTDLAIPYIKKNSLDIIIIASVDSLYFIKNYTVDENLFYKLNDLKELLKVDGEMFLQTRRELKEFNKMATNKFYSAELQARELSFLPPFYTIVTFEFKDSGLDIEFLRIFKKDVYRLKGTFKYIYYIKSDIWQQDKILRSQVCETLKNLNLKVNPMKIIE